MVQAGGHQDTLLAEDAGLGSIGQDDPPPLQACLDAAAVNDGSNLGCPGQRSANFMRPARRSQVQLCGHAFQANGIYLAIALLDPTPGSFCISPAALTLDLNFLPKKGYVQDFLFIT
jgi:hypothetical protein